MVRINHISRNFGLIAIGVLLINTILFKVGWTETLTFSMKFIRAEQFGDSWKPMDRALSHLKNESVNDLVYNQLFFKERVKFQYPLTSLLVPYLLSIFIVDYVMMLKLITWLSVVVTIYFVILIFHHATASPLKANMNTFIISGSCLCLALSSYPIVKAYNLGQIQVWITAMFSALFYCWIKGWPVRSGILLGAICLIKPHYLLIGLWGILRKRMKFAASFLGVFLIGIICSSLAFGIKNNLNYFPVLFYLSRHGEAFYPNQSMNGMLNRFFHNGNILDWYSHAFPPFNAQVYYGTVFFGICLLLLSYILPVIYKKAASSFDLAIISIASTMVSPIAWEHHYGILLPIYIFVLAKVLFKENLFHMKKWLLVTFTISYLFSSNFIPILNSFAGFRCRSIVLSYLFLSAVALLGILFILTAQHTKEELN